MKARLSKSVARLPDVQVTDAQLIIPLEAVVDAEKAPTLEFAETIEIKCVDPDDQMSIDSYFFASFQDLQGAYATIQQLLADRPSSDLPRVSSNLSLEAQAAEAESSQAAQQKQKSTIAGLPIPKLGSVLKPLISRSSDRDSQAEDKSGISVPFVSSKSKSSHDSLATLRQEEEYDGYPPRQTGPLPSSFEEKAWTPDWIRRPTNKLLGTSPSKEPHRTPSWNTSRHRATGRRKEPVTEVVEPVVSDSEESDAEQPKRKKTGATRSTSMSKDRSDFSLAGDEEEDEEIAAKFRKVFSLNEKEELIDREYQRDDSRELFE